MMKGWSSAVVILCVVLHELKADDDSDPTTGKVYNGRDAKPWRFRWAVRLLSATGEFRCSGSLVLPNLVLTAAHCLPSAVLVSVGDYNALIPGDGEQIINITKKHAHPEYGFDDEDIFADIGLLELAEKADLSEKSAQMVPRLANEKDQRFILRHKPKCLINGWGYMNRNGRWMIADVLQKLKVVFMDWETCKNKTNVPNNEDGVCLTAKKGPNAAACPGDSGTPLVCRLKDQWVQFAILSWGVYADGCRSGIKGATSVPYFQKWLEELAPKLRFEK